MEVQPVPMCFHFHSAHVMSRKNTVSTMVVNELNQVPIPVMLLPDDFKANSKIKVTNHLFNRENLPSHFKFKDYCPQVFRNLRERFEIDDQDYQASLTRSSPYSESEAHGGRFLLSYDKTLAVKEISSDDVANMHSILSDYHQHIVKCHGSTLLPQFLGMYRLSVENEDSYMLVMRNMFSHRLTVHRKYDLKGSLVSREASDKEKVKELPTLKDMDFLNMSQKVYVDEEQKKAFMEKLKRDVEFLIQLKMMDYSLLLGINDVHRCEQEDEEEMDEEDPENEAPALLNVGSYGTSPDGIAGYLNSHKPLGPGEFEPLIDVYAVKSSDISFVLSRMAACGGTQKNKVTVNKSIWDFLSKEAPSKLDQLSEENKVRILIDGETPEIYVLRLSPENHITPNGLHVARKALKTLLKETEKELKKSHKQHQLTSCMTYGDKNNDHGGELHIRNVYSRGQHSTSGRGIPGCSGGASSSHGGSRDHRRDEAEDDRENQCPICLGEIQNIKTLEKCQHSFCEDCITRALQVKKACPMCGRFYGQLVGNQPENGRMLVSKDSGLLLPSYEKYGTIIIQYVFPPGIQGAEHPNPGVRYPGTTRVAYLPDCPEGNKVLTLFKKAFDQRLTFTIGTSMTTGRPNVITWNDIHHKTNCTGGPQLFGYPDPTYLLRVQEELRAKGITAD
uniref:E3 ubiquitin-protein ligase n=1 Tax=Leptobrachium leishanense TaxID=445787 RepID=A0A8C5PQF5_9ANUR